MRVSFIDASPYSMASLQYFAIIGALLPIPYREKAPKGTM